MMTNKQKMIKLDKKLMDFIINLNKKQFDDFIITFEDLLSTVEMEQLQKYYASKSLIVHATTSILNREDFNKWVRECYNDDVNKINYILQNDKLINKIGGVKILFYGPTGTGKTTIVNEIINMNSNINYEIINFINLISSKMGQTQINLINLAEELNQKKQKTIIFLDELDSIVTNRINSDLGEHSRIVATFIKFLDLLSNDIIFISATNFKDNIDDAILRRFTIQFETKNFTLNKFLNFLRNEGFVISKQRENFLLSHINSTADSFSFSDMKIYIDTYNLDQELNLVKNNWTHFLKYFWTKFDIDILDSSLSEREKTELKSLMKGEIK